MPGLDNSDGAPRYREIADVLAAEVPALDHGQKLPSERDLAGRFACQRVTIREALHHLESDGTIFRRGRAGWFRTPERLDYDVGASPPLADLAVAQGRELHTEVIERDPRSSTPPEDHLCFVARRRRTLDRWPILVEEITVAQTIADRIDGADLTRSTAGILAALGVAVTEERVTIESTGAPAWAAELLNLRVGAPLLAVTRTRWGEGVLLQRDLEWWRADSVRIHAAVRAAARAGPECRP